MRVLLAYNRVLGFHPPDGVMVATDAEIREEAMKVRRLQLVMDLVTSTLQQEDMPVEEASELVAATRRFALNLFPDKGHTFDLLYRPRLQRILSEKYKII
jgi:hypothetical protein